MGISPHRFTGWEPSQHTRYLYDDGGRLVESVTTREPEWDDIDQALITTHIDYQNSLCDCGQPLSESLFDKDKEPTNYRGYYLICQSCMAKERAEHKHSKSREKSVKPGDFDPHHALKWQTKKIN